MPASNSPSVRRPRRNARIAVTLFSRLLKLPPSEQVLVLPLITSLITEAEKMACERADHRAHSLLVNAAFADAG